MYLFIALLASSIILFLGFLVYFHYSESVSNRIFFIHSIVTAFEAIENYVSISVPLKQSLFWIRLNLFFAAPHLFLLLLFVLNFPNEKFVVKKRVFWMLSGLTLALMIMTMTPLVFKGLVVDSQSLYAHPVPGLGIPLFGSFLILLPLATFVLIFRRYFKSTGIEKKQWLAISIGLITSHSLLIAIFVTVAVFKNNVLVPWFSVFILPMFIGNAYAILKYRLLNVKVLTTEFFSFALLFISVWQILLAKTMPQIILQSLVTVAIFSFSILLIRSVLREVRQREELQKLSKDLENANEQLKLLDKAKSEFLSVTSHQLRTPLTAIKGYVSMMLEGDFGQVQPKQKEVLNTVSESTERLVHLISDLLDLSRIESGRMEFDFVALNLCEMVKSVIDELKQKAAQKNLYLYFDNVHRSCPNIRADDEKIRQVVINLIDNAIKYTVSGGVTVRLMVVGDDLQFSVADTGIGIAAEDKPKMFEQFFRSEQANEVTHEGTGLGIYVVKKIVEAHHGKIWFESAGSGKGTTFFVNLPIPKGPILEERVKISSLEAF